MTGTSITVLAGNSGRLFGAEGLPVAGGKMAGFAQNGAGASDAQAPA